MDFCCASTGNGGKAIYPEVIEKAKYIPSSAHSVHGVACE